MVAKFEEGKTYKFSKEEYIRQSGGAHRVHLGEGNWVDRVSDKIITFTEPFEAKIVVDNPSGMTTTYIIIPPWCIEVEA
jgi:hypothetical protein